MIAEWKEPSAAQARTPPVSFCTPGKVASCLLFVLLAVHPLLAVDPDRRISQYSHSAWRTRDGSFTGSPTSLTQAEGGYIWLGTTNGLFHFDGVRFVPWTSPEGARLPSSFVNSLLGARDGSLWIRANGGLSHLQGGHLVTFTDAEHRSAAMVEDHKGDIWISRYGPDSLCHLNGNKIACFGKADGIPTPTPYAGIDALAVDGAGSFWIGRDTSLLQWGSKGTASYSPKGLSANTGMSGVTALAADPDGSLWAGAVFPGPGLGLQHFVAGTWRPFVTPQFDSSSLEIRSLFIDSHRALWAGTTHEGVYRIANGHVDRFAAQDGLSGNEVSHFYEDAEGNMWVVTSNGVDKFSDLAVNTYSTTEGLATTEVDAVLAARNGQVWVGGADALDVLKEGEVFPAGGKGKLRGKQVTSLLEDVRGRVWVGVNNTLTIFEDGNFREIKKGDGSPFGIVSDMVEDSAGTIWIEAGGLAKSLIRIATDGIPHPITAPEASLLGRVAADSSGNVWIGTRDGKLVRLHDGHATVMPFPGDHASRVEQVLAEPDGSVMGATAYGLIASKDGKQQMMTSRNGLPCDNVFAMVRDADKKLWLYMPCGLVKIEQAEVNRWWTNPDRVLNLTKFDEFNGVQPGLAPFQKAAKSPDGRLWFANNIVLQTIDPHRLYENTTTPPVRIETVWADRKKYQPVQDLRLPALTRGMEIDYTALSFTVPQRVQFRYRLEGYDKDWETVGTRRQAFYNNLKPGTYRFTVLASNNSGVWNQVGSSIAFTVEPAWFQTRWFAAVCVLLAAAILYGLYWLRVRQVRQRLQLQYETRLEERTRVARDLHDTLLQTIQGTKLVAEEALQGSEDSVKLHNVMTKIYEWLSRAVIEGRAALTALRTDSGAGELADQLRSAAGECAAGSSIELHFGSIGVPTSLPSETAEEIFRIGYEAIRNACAHSKGNVLDVQLTYGKQLSLRVKDNGIGFDSIEVAGRAAGHYGLEGMRERSRQLNGVLSITSAPGAGTEVLLTVKASRR